MDISVHLAILVIINNAKGITFHMWFYIFVEVYLQSRFLEVGFVSKSKFL